MYKLNYRYQLLQKIKNRTFYWLRLFLIAYNLYSNVIRYGFIDLYPGTKAGKYT